MVRVCTTTCVMILAFAFGDFLPQFFVNDDLRQSELELTFSLLGLLAGFAASELYFAHLERLHRSRSAARRRGMRATQTHRTGPPEHFSRRLASFVGSELLNRNDRFESKMPLRILAPIGKPSPAKSGEFIRRILHRIQVILRRG
ncbi:hypothetical protein Pla22_30320 [Rubripirellula amarantea]|uniref:Uncharacterized protein n=1 Tax=Rubripirellula amarantea TaxID=2527999 RepID=A0A5C5WJV4_9BACT|nr:hypothetical protein [Rubripirellula amarantea]TWT50291.1 hypothetical protein Pla22_30320 [Rubripirellula amarantea]